MIQVLHASHNGELYKRRVQSADDIADLIRETRLETVTNRSGVDFWFTPSKQHGYRRVNRKATEIFLATTRLSATRVPLLHGNVIMAARDATGELAGLTDEQVAGLARALDATTWWQELALSWRCTREQRSQIRADRADQARLIKQICTSAITHGEFNQGAKAPTATFGPVKGLGLPIGHLQYTVTTTEVLDRVETARRGVLAAGVPENNRPLIKAFIAATDEIVHHESAWNPIAVGPAPPLASRVEDGHPYPARRGLWQHPSSQFFCFHVPGTSPSIYDPVASIAAGWAVMAHSHNVDLHTGEGLQAALTNFRAHPEKPWGQHKEWEFSISQLSGPHSPLIRVAPRR